ncbi:hypothetical protein MKW94_025659 [Papaver nudicaule]|uniref:RING-type domain-containing protein n=1 Tax=Papaver nudicaule TaxID=74823 RepID=A0AA42AYL5_PAPNU|nr:hypothetical protein [Papaver nudicaule]MCL7043907.1 hypothetical protein [Papaver nudicaule]
MSSVTENNTVSDEDTIERFSSVRMKPFKTLGTQNKVENPYDDTQVFVEVQFRTKSHVYLTRNDILVDMTLSRKKFESVARRRLTTVKILPINLVDLFASDIFRNCNFETLSFWNFFKRVVSRYGNKMANLCLKVKRSVITIVVRVELVNVRRNEYNDEDEAFIGEYFLSCRRHRLNRLSERHLKDNINDENQEEIHLSVLEMVDIKRFNENDGDGSEECAICLGELMKGDKVMKFECGHQFHNKCIIQWINKNELRNFCPICMEELNVDLIF